MDQILLWFCLIGMIFFTVRWAMYGAGNQYAPWNKKSKRDDDDDYDE
jgi:hypothetical protein